VSSLAQPGGNITGFAGQEFTVATKMLELLKKIAPNVTQVAFLYDPAPTAMNWRSRAAPIAGRNSTRRPQC